jgi:signal peptidase I
MSGLSTILGATAGVRPFAIAGDGMMPALRHGDFLLVAAVDRFMGEGVYLLDFDADGEAPFVAQPKVGSGEVIIGRQNPLYAKHEVSMEAFCSAVTAMAVAEVRLKVGLDQVVGMIQ